MRSGKGVWIPKFGHFTFTAISIDLSVSLTFLKNKINILRALQILKSEISKRGFLCSLWEKILSALSLSRLAFRMVSTMSQIN